MRPSGLRARYIGPPSFYKEALSIALPVMAQQLVQSLVSLVDQFMVAGLGDVRMSGVNIAGQMVFIFQVLLNTVCMAGGIFMTQYCGAEDRRGMGQVLRFKTLAALAAVLLFFIPGYFFPRPLLSLMVIGNTDAEAILNHGVVYLRILSFGALPFAAAGVLASSLREIGTVRPPLYFAVSATLVNTFLNWVLIYGHLGAPALGASGAAIATVVASCAQVAMLAAYCLRRRPPFLFPIREFFRTDRALILRILSRGGFVLFNEMAWVFSETVQTALYNGRGGADVVSGMASSFAIANLFFVAFGGISTAVGVLLGKSLGSGNLEEARRRKNWLMAASVVFGLAMTALGLFAMLLVPVVFGRLSAAALSICRNMVFMMALFMPLWVYQNALLAVTRAGGDTAMNFWTDALVTMLVSLPLMFLLAWRTKVGPVGMYFAVKLLDVLKIALGIAWVRRGAWLRNLTVYESGRNA